VNDSDENTKNVGAGPWGSQGSREELEAYLAKVNEEMAVRAERLRQLEAVLQESSARLRRLEVGSNMAGRFVAAAFGQRRKERAAQKNLERQKEEAHKEFERASERKQLVEIELKLL